MITIFKVKIYFNDILTRKGKLEISLGWWQAFPFNRYFIMITLETISNCSFWIYCLMYESIHNMYFLLIWEVNVGRLLIVWRCLWMSAWKGFMHTISNFPVYSRHRSMKGESGAYTWQLRCSLDPCPFIASLAPLIQFVFHLPLSLLHSLFHWPHRKRSPPPPPLTLYAMVSGILFPRKPSTIWLQPSS